MAKKDPNPNAESPEIFGKRFPMTKESVDEFLTLLRSGIIWSKEIQDNAKEILAFVSSIPVEIWKQEKVDSPSMLHFCTSSGIRLLEFLWDALPKTEEAMAIQDKNGWSVAHSLAKCGEYPEEGLRDEILLRKNEYGVTVANILATKKALPLDRVSQNVLSYRTPKGKNLAHSLAKRKHFVNFQYFPTDILTEPDPDTHTRYYSSIPVLEWMLDARKNNYLSVALNSILDPKLLEFISARADSDIAKAAEEEYKKRLEHDTVCSLHFSPEDNEDVDETLYGCETRSR